MYYCTWYPAEIIAFQKAKNAKALVILEAMENR